MAIEFDKDAVDKAADNLQLSQLFVVVSRSSWMALVAVGTILINALIWSILGSIPKTVIGRAILVGDQDTVLVSAISSGVIRNYAVEIGDRVHEGQLIATLENEPLRREFMESQAATEHLESINASLTKLERDRLDAASKAWSRQLSSIASQKKEFESLLAQQSSLLKTQKKLVEQGLIAQVTWLEQQEELARLESEIISLDKESEQISIDSAELDLTISQQRDTRAFQILTFREKTEHLKALYAQQAQILAPVDGLIEQVRTRTGDVVQQGMPVAQIKKNTASFSAPMHCIVYVTLPKSKRIEIGQDVNVELTMALANRYGYMKGVVQEVAMLPSSEQDLMLDLANKSMTKYLLDQGPVLRVTVKLNKDADTASGFKWTTRYGYPSELTPGTTCVAHITVQSVTPISLLVPWVESMFYGQVPKQDEL